MVLQTHFYPGRPARGRAPAPGGARPARPGAILFLRKEKTREQAKEVLMLSDSYKSEEDIERELDFIYSAPLEILEDEYKRKIHLFHKLGFVLSDSVPIS